MRAFLLAAGLGTRLAPLTEHTPKCMLPIGGRPLLDIWLDSLAGAGVDEVVVNLHHLPHVVEAHLATRTGAPKIQMFFEPVLLGSAGTLVANKEFVNGEAMFLACNADNLTDFDLGRLVDCHRSGDAVATLAAYHSDNPSACGVLEADEDGRLTGFVEKPSEPRSDLVNAGLYAFHPSVLDEIDGPAPQDIGYDLLPGLVGRARVVMIDGYFRDIGTPLSYSDAQDEWP